MVIRWRHRRREDAEVRAQRRHEQVLRELALRTAECGRLRSELEARTHELTAYSIERGELVDRIAELAGELLEQRNHAEELETLLEQARRDRDAHAQLFEDARALLRHTEHEKRALRAELEAAARLGGGSS